MYDLICFGSLVIDLYFKADDYVSEEGKFFLSTMHRKDADYFVKSIGGGAVNVAIGAQNLGLKVGLASVMGNNFFVSTIIKKLDELGLDYSLSEFIDNYYNISLVLTTESGERSIINYRSPYTSKYNNPLEMQMLFNTKVLFMANLPNLQLEVRTEIVKQAKKRNIITIANLGISDCHKGMKSLKEFLENCNVLIINKVEFSALVKQPETEIDLKTEICKSILPGVDVVVVTDSDKGSYAYDGNDIYFEPAQMLKKVKDLNGAGDAYTAGFIFEYLKNHDISAAMKKGSFYSSQIVSRIGAN